MESALIIGIVLWGGAIATAGLFVLAVMFSPDEK
jgi:hypothetical protein